MMFHLLLRLGREVLELRGSGSTYLIENMQNILIRAESRELS